MLKRLKYIYREIRRRCRIQRTNCHNQYDLKGILNSPHKLLFLIHSAANGGAPMLAKHIMYQLRKENYGLVIVCLEPGEMLEEFLGLGYVYMPQNKHEFEKLLKSLKGSGIDRCICNSALTGIFSEQLKKYGYHTVSLIHELPNTIEKNCVKNRLVSMLKYSDIVIFPSSVVKDRCLAYANSTRIQGIQVKPQGLFLTQIRQVNKNMAKTAIANKYGFSQEKKIVLNVASAIYRKGLDFFLQACQKDPEKQYIWVGISDNSFYTQCIAGLGGSLPQNFTPVGYIKKPEELQVFYEAADVLALTSREEPFGSVVLEAFSAGTPVAAFAGCGGFVDVVRDGMTGYLADEISADGILTAIHQCTEPERMAILRDNCVALVKNMNFENYIQFIMDGFDTCEGECIINEE